VIKTKSVLLDAKVSYFMPLNGYNRELRGVLLQGAANLCFEVAGAGSVTVAR
jgi:hypothetical protein